MRPTIAALSVSNGPAVETAMALLRDVLRVEGVDAAPGEPMEAQA